MRYLKILLIIAIVLFTYDTILASDYIREIPGNNTIKGVSIWYETDTSAKDIGYKILKIIKYFLQGVFIIFLVYAGGQMIMSMGDNEEQLNSSKKQLWYSLIALLFINIPGTLYESFKRTQYGTIETLVTKQHDGIKYLDGNILINSYNFKKTFENNIIEFFKIIIYISAIVMLTLSAYKILISGGTEEEVNKGKKFFIYSIIALVFAGIIEMWKYVFIGFHVKEGYNLFSTLANVALYLAGPISIFFLSLAGYYYITSNGDDEKIKKAKSIIVNTIIGFILMLASYSILKDITNITI